MGNKYHARRCEFDGHKFDSRAECDRYIVLREEVKTDEIYALRVHPRFLLQEDFYDASGKHWAAIYYEADFEYAQRRPNKWIVEDVKGMRTAVFRLKEKMFRKLYGQIYHLSVLDCGKRTVRLEALEEKR